MRISFVKLVECVCSVENASVLLKMRHRYSYLDVEGEDAEAEDEGNTKWYNSVAT